MKYIAKIILFVLVGFCCITAKTYAQDSTRFRHWEFRANVGYNIGGTIPIPFPVEIREIQKFSPSPFSPHLAFEGTYWFTEKWGITAQFTFDFKGFSVQDSVVNLYTKIEKEGDVYEGYFSGINTTKVKNSYFTVPIMASFRPTPKWLIQAGFYLGYLYSPSFKANIIRGYIRETPTANPTELNESAGQDFSDNQRKFDFGVQASGEWYFTKRFSVRGQFSYGIPTLFPSDFTAMPFSMHNIYGTIGIGYTFRKI